MRKNVFLTQLLLTKQPDSVVVLLVEGELVVRFEVEVGETSAPTILSQTFSANVKRRERSCSVFLRGIVK